MPNKTQNTPYKSSMNSDTTPELLLTCAINAAKKAGKHAMNNKALSKKTIATFKHDIKLVLDQECQKIAEDEIYNTFPTHQILGEEDHEEQDKPNSNSDYLWIIDPIDGTVNFSHGLPWWCCAIAVQHQNKIIAGAIYAPDMDRIYSASTNQTSQCNKEPIKVSNTSSLAEALIMTGMDKSENPDIPPLSIFQAISRNTQKTRILGSAALDLCNLAEGNADGYYEKGIYLWDIAAASIIVEQAGGTTKIFNYTPESHRLEFLASNGKLQDDITNVIKTVHPALS